MNHDTIAVDRSEFGTFIHSELDDARLSVHAFRIYCHLARRANATGKAWPGALSMARVCQIGESSVRKGIAELEARGMVTVIRSSGGRLSNHYYLNSKKTWTPADADGHPFATQTGLPRKGHPFATQGAPPRHAKGTPLPRKGEGIPIRESIEGDPEREPTPAAMELFSEGEVETEDSKAERLYKAYPRKEGHGAAMKKIKIALKTSPFDDLLKSVEAFAAASKGKEAKYIPHAATWFHQERWKDQPEPTTSRNESKSASKGLW